MAQVSDTSGDRGSYVESSVALTIGDCSRTVSLDFPMYRRPERRNSVRKARLLAGLLTEFATALEAEAEVADRRHALQRKERAAEAEPQHAVDWMVSVDMSRRVPGITDEQFEGMVDRLGEVLSPHSASVSWRPGPMAGATMTVQAMCRDDAPAVARDAFRRALARVGIDYPGPLSAQVWAATE